MPHAPRSSASCAEMQTKLSAWTPLNHPAANGKVFEERRSLLAKWFDRWSDSQRRAVLRDLVLSCTREQLRSLSASVSARLPPQAADFTCLLPRALCLYLFSFLDPRSLCRCAQVSWHWRSIVELDQLWTPKCLRLGWRLGFSPTPLEQGVWKRHYVQTVQELRLALLQRCVIPDVTATSGRREEPQPLAEERPASAARRVGSSLRVGSVREKQPATPPPWRDSDRCPKDTRRFNYLDNLDPTEQAPKARMRSTAATTTCSRGASQPDGGSGRTLSEANYKLRKAKSLMFLSSNCTPQHPPPPPPPPPPPLHPHHQSQTRPQWASPGNSHPITKETAGIRPGPVRLAVPQLSVAALRACRRSHRSAPSTPLFEVQPWIAPASSAQ